MEIKRNLIVFMFENHSQNLKWNGYKVLDIGLKNIAIHTGYEVELWDISEVELNELSV